MKKSPALILTKANHKFSSENTVFMAHLELYIFYRRKAFAFLPLKTYNL